MEGWFAFVLAGFALAGSPGPATLSIAASAAAFGAGRTLGYVAGITVGLLVVIAVTASGLTGVVLAVPGAATIVAVAAAAYFVYLAWRIATAPPLVETGDRDRQPSMAGGFLLSLANPKGYAAMAALFSGFRLAPQHLGLDIALKVATLLAIIVTVEICWLLAGAALTGVLRRPRASRAINVTFAILLLVSVVAALPF